MKNGKNKQQTVCSVKLHICQRFLFLPLNMIKIGSISTGQILQYYFWMISSQLTHWLQLWVKWAREKQCKEMENEKSY